MDANSHPLNTVALEKLAEAGQVPDDAASPAIQLARWGLEETRDAPGVDFKLANRLAELLDRLALAEGWDALDELRADEIDPRALRALGPDAAARALLERLVASAQRL